MGITLQAIVEVRFEGLEIWDDVCEFDLYKDYQLMNDLNELEGRAGVRRGWPNPDENLSLRARLEIEKNASHDRQTVTPRALVSLLSASTTEHLREPDDPPFWRSPRFRALCAAVTSLVEDPLLGDDRVRVLLSRE